MGQRKEAFPQRLSFPVVPEFISNEEGCLSLCIKMVTFPILFLPPLPLVALNISDAGVGFLVACE